jgi:hypothetical protein
VLGLIGLLFLFALFPVEISGSIDKMEVAVGGAKMELSRLPLAIPASVAWSILFILALRYCQIAVTIERQCNYLHGLEDEIVPTFGAEKNVYQREGHAYRQGKPLLTHWAWIFYTVLFPMMGIGLMVVLVLAEKKAKAPHEFNVTYDLFAAIGVTLTLVLFVVPQLRKRFREYRKKDTEGGGT